MFKRVRQHGNVWKHGADLVNTGNVVGVRVRKKNGFGFQMPIAQEVQQWLWRLARINHPTRGCACLSRICGHFHHIGVGLTATQFKGVKFPKALTLENKASFDVVKADRVGLEVRVTGLERTFVDVLNRPDLTGSWEEIWRSLESVEFFDLDKVASYVDLLGNATTAAKVGFYLEQHRDSLMVDEAHLKTFRDRRPRRPHYLERSRRKAGRFVAAWNLVVPEEVYGRSWEELR